MDDIVIIAPEPPDGIFCAGCTYCWEVQCPDAVSVRWEVIQTPLGIDPDSVTIRNVNGFKAEFVFPVSGTSYGVVPVCLRPAA